MGIELKQRLAAIHAADVAGLRTAQSQCMSSTGSLAYMNAVRLVFLVVLSLGLFAVPRVPEAQSQISVRRIAYLASDGPNSPTCALNSRRPGGLTALLEGLHSFGYREGQNFTIECRSAESKYERLDALAAELVQLKPSVIVAAAAPASLAAKRATSSIPIISVYTADPVGLGLVASLSRPGANVTGLSALALDYVAKSLQLLKEIAPRISRVGVLGHGANPTYAIYRRELESAGRALGIVLDFGQVNVLADIEVTLSAMQKRGADGFLVMHQPFTFEHRQDIVNVLTRYRLPAIYGSQEAVELGGLMSYAVSVSEVFRRAAYFVDRILHGYKPADLPVEQPTNFEMAINMKTAKALGVQFPQTILVRADRVID
jgi:putative ABC transport system substrate-binding protein